MKFAKPVWVTALAIATVAVVSIGQAPSTVPQELSFQGTRPPSQPPGGGVAFQGTRPPSQPPGGGAAFQGTRPPSQPPGGGAAFQGTRPPSQPPGGGLEI